MTAVLRVLAPGLLTTIQDLGRPGHQTLGIPVSGALDPVSLRVANALVGNTPGTGALEVAYVGPTLVVEEGEVRLSFAGADAPIEVLSHARATSGRRIANMRSIRLYPGEGVRIGSLSGGAVLYIGVEGGFDVEPVLGSVSTYLRGSFGGWQGRALAAGDRLPLRLSEASDAEDSQIEDIDLTPPRRFRVIAGPQSDYFSSAAIDVFLNGEYTIGTGADRMGMRLDGPRLEHSRPLNFTSDGIAPGSIQVPGNGQPIVLLADRQTVGGYPKIATVISADLPALGRLPMGSKIRFAPATIDEAEAARRKLVAMLEGLSGKIVPIMQFGADVTPRLLDCNLIGGVIDASVGAMELAELR
jgi:biotin-dependent carboxylase-like uncharacterized protein